jgi:ribosome recycling factor
MSESKRNLAELSIDEKNALIKSIERKREQGRIRRRNWYQRHKEQIKANRKVNKITVEEIESSTSEYVTGVKLAVKKTRGRKVLPMTELDLELFLKKKLKN